ncbi:hypothetical protein MCANUF31_02705 [Mycoplasmopsis canis UF31]|uniref:putative immunoglobulin-blocking virulence protein n=1 Tax=Mycoplasmopsis canis TaxID=29555 RepID=UPI00025AEC85|nr:putative immunoglobulin-blocking virulence protein [Mycoplasmopsis canis]EIE39576.1 hypothetical protein MCANUF31_02705 [Mycoplasmopsis canis UF31]
MLNRKKKIMLITSTIGITTAISASTVIHMNSANTKGFKFKISPGTTRNFIADSVDLTKTEPAATDINVPILKNPPIVKPIIQKDPLKTEIIPKIDDKKKEIKNPILPKSTNSSKSDILPKKDEKPSQPTLEITDPTLKPKPAPTETRVIIKDNIKYFVEVTPLQPRVNKKSDIEKGIVNRKNYRAEFTPDVHKISGALTPENIAASVANAQANGKIQDLTFGATSSYRPILEDPNRDLARKQNYLDNVGSADEQMAGLWSRYLQLLKNKETIYKYVDDIARSHFEEWWNSKETISWDQSNGRQTVPLGHFLLIMHIDHTKITKLSKQVLDELAQGNVIPKDGGNLSVNENGEWVSHTFKPPYNAVLARTKNENQHFRVLGNNKDDFRTPNQIEKGKYTNWNDVDKTNYYASIGINEISGGGISVTEYTRKEKIEGENREKATVVTIDVSVPNAYRHAKSIMEKFISKGIEITGYRIKGIGLSGDQNMDDILAALPQELPLLELFFESRNTSALRKIHNKKIDELGLYTNNKVNSLADDWSFNPWALNNVAWLNMNDYNVSFSYSPRDTIYTVITFDNLAFDPEDLGPNGSLDKINDGLRMAYWSRNNERIFQGGWGSGNKPDRHAASNSYTMGLDLSRIPSIKSLRGLIFTNEDNPSEKRMLNKIKLFNNSDTFQIATTEMNEAQFDEILIKQTSMPRSKIMFSNGSATQKIKIIPTSNDNTLSSSGLRNLSVLMQFSDGNFSKSSTEIIVPEGSHSLLNTLRNSGFNARFESEDDLYEPY